MVFKYNPDAQKKYDAPVRESLLNVDKKFQWKLDWKSSGDYSPRILPPWSSEGSIIKGTKTHFLMGKGFVCPDVLGEHQCRFCLEKATKMSGKENYEKYKPDADEIRVKHSYVANAGNVDNPNLGALIFNFGSQIYDGIMAIQKSGRWGDIADLENGRNIFIQRRIVKGRVVDSVQALPEITAANPDWLDFDTYGESGVRNLDGVFPEPMDKRDVETMFNAYPWKVYEPAVSVQVPRTYDGSPEKKETISSPVTSSTTEASSSTPTTPPVQKSNAEDVAARLRAKLAAAKAKPAA